MQYTHTGDPIDVTFGVKELKVSKFVVWDLIVFEFVYTVTSIVQFDKPRLLDRDNMQLITVVIIPITFIG